MGIRTNPMLSVICRPIIWIAGFVGRHFPMTLVKVRYFVRFHKRPNLRTPRTLNEKILYLSFNTDTTMWTRLADKYNVREYISECGLSDILVPLYGYWENANQIDFDSLPNSFVLKTTQGSGDVIIIRDKSKIITEEVIKQMNKAVKTHYGELEGGKHYMRIKPAIIAEGLMVNDDETAKYSTSIIDYKIWCFNGKAYYVWACCNRDKHGAEVMTYDLDWRAYPEYSIFNSHFSQSALIPKPKNFSQMISVAEKLSKPFPVVRVDLYNINGCIYFGEMTFTSFGGLMKVYSEKFQNIAGDLIDINYKG